MTFRNLLLFFLGTSLIFGLSACGGASPVVDVQATVASAVQATVAAQPATSPTLVMGPGAGRLFDDFNYAGPTDPNLMKNAWTARAESGGPGIPGATWSLNGVSFLDDPDQASNRLMQLSSSTDGTPQQTRQAELYHQRKFYEGTYASRVRFFDEPTTGPDGDNVVETFFTITPLNYDLEADYGEVDFEYLPNGGWDVPETTFYLTTWETYQAEPWLADNQSDLISQSFAGWHTLVAQVAQGKVKYYVDGNLVADHRDQFYPETPMAIHYNLWFISEGTIDSAEPRTYIQQADWVYYAGNEIFTPEQVEAHVADYRSATVAHVDTVPKWTAPAVVPPTPIPTAAPAGPRPFAIEVKPVTGINVDGDLKDWSAEPNFVLDQADHIIYALTPGNWGGPTDFSAKLWLGWTEAGLYLASQVVDDKHVQQWTAVDIWQGDYLEVQLDADLEGDYNEHSLNEDDFQFGFSPGDFAGVAPGYNIWYGVVDEAQKKNLQQAQVKTAEGYNLEVFIPNGLVPGLTLSEGLSIGLNINPSDGDNPEAPQKQMMSTSPIRLLRDPTTFGQVTFVK